MRPDVPFQTLLDEAIDAVILSDSVDHVVYANPVAITRLTGANTPEPWFGQPLQAVLQSLTDPEWVVAPLPTPILPRGLKLWLVTNLNRQPTSTLEILLQALGLQNQDTDLNYSTEALITILADKVKPGVNLPSHESNGESAKLSPEPEPAQVLQAGRLATLGELAVGVSHEIKNPLMMMTGMLELALDGLAEGDTRAAMADIQQALSASERVTQVVDRLLAFAQGASTEHEVIPVVSVIDRAHSLVAERLRLAGIDVRIDCPAELQVRCQPDALSQVFLNLLLNSREALRLNGGQVHVQAWSSEPDTIEIRVQDTGPGIPADLQPRIFDPFFSTKGASSGTGLGLPISREVVQAHGGDIRYDHAETGATFRITLPRSASHDPDGG